MTVLRSPTFEQNCTFKEHTVTATHYTDCGGCALQTRVLGVGLVRLPFVNAGGAKLTVAALSDGHDRAWTQD